MDKFILKSFIILALAGTTLAASAGDEDTTEAGNAEVALCTTGQCHNNQNGTPLTTNHAQDQATVDSLMREQGTPAPALPQKSEAVKEDSL